MKTNTISFFSGGRLVAVSTLIICMATSIFASTAKPYIGNWALIIPTGRAGWLGVERVQDGSIKSSMLWGGGSPYAMNETKIRDNTLVMTRVKKEKNGKINTEVYEAKVEGQFIKINRRIINDQGKQVNNVSFGRISRLVQIMSFFAVRASDTLFTSATGYLK